MNATVTFSGLNVWQLGRLIRAAERAGGLPEPVVKMYTDVDLWLVGNGANRIAVIKAIRETLDNGLKEAKDMSDRVTEGTPVVIVRAVAEHHKHALRVRFEAAGATIEFRDHDMRKAEG